ncbi:hypothetical protein IV203_006185 [Nitzschia inconspicua]|uniref:Uncharacterized protein n=1 Tax=Nitzschia inconspicua TaxID=303405 RepID=A0A9K3KPJ9_9STRA|nr:hypothetical protein IV203_006185 [Nitzschia inconspicua]
MRCNGKLRGWVRQRWPMAGRRNLVSASSSAACLQFKAIPVLTWPTYQRYFSSRLPVDVNDLNSKITTGNLEAIGTNHKFNNCGTSGSPIGEHRLNIIESPVLKEAATRGRTAMELLSTAIKVPLKSQFENEERRRQSLKQATESLLYATKATATLAETIAEIRMRKQLKFSKQENFSDPAAVCLSELHKTFLNLSQDLLNCVDPNLSASESAGPYSSMMFPTDDQLVDLLLKLCYRAHQLSLSFTWPLYQRLAIALAKQQQLSTVRSKAEWILYIYQWSQGAWGSFYESSAMRGAREDPVNIEWFRPSLLELARNKHFSDLSYLLRKLLHPPPPTVLNDFSFNCNNKRGRRRKSNEKEVDKSYYPKFPVLDELLVMDLLRAFDYHGVLPSLRKNLHNPSGIEKDVLQILVLMGPSIWNVFDDEPDVVSKPVSVQNKHQLDNGGTKACKTLKMSLLDAIEILLQSSRTSDRIDIIQASANNDEEPDSADVASDGDTARLLREVQDMIEESNDELDDDLEEEGQDAIDAIAIAAILLENKPSRFPRDLEVRSRRSGDGHVLEISGTIDSNSSQSDLAFTGGKWLDIEDDSTDIIYSRLAAYQDDIPDVASQIFEHNGNKPLRYQEDFEDEIYESLRQSHEDWNGTSDDL